MIFVTLGTQKFQLNRLLKLLDDLCRTQKIKEEIFAQIGHSDYCPMHYNYIDLLDKELFEKKVKESSLVISHGGAGSIMSALKEDKPVIVFPRLRKYREHVDDHQLEIAGALSKKKLFFYAEKMITYMT